jgi:hypothetical protein
LSTSVRRQAHADRRSATATRLCSSLFGGDHLASRRLGEPLPAHARPITGITSDLSDEQLARIGAAMPVDEVAGERYPAEHMAALDSER